MAARIVTREQVLSLCATLFAENGYRATSLELVGQRLGVTRQALYYHFRGKDDILMTLFDRLMHRFEAAVDVAEPDEGESRFAAMIRAHIGVAVQNVSLVAVLLHERPEITRVRGAYANARRREYAQRFVDAYAVGTQEGTLLPLEPWLAVGTVIGAINGVARWYQQSSASPSVVAQEIYTLVAGGFENPSGQGGVQPDAAAVHMDKPPSTGTTVPVT